MIDVWVTIGAGLLGYVMRAEDYLLTPMVLGLILGPIAEVTELLPPDTDAMAHSVRYLVLEQLRQVVA
ncbi:hypothetical protein [Halomicrococcus sp. NG-SE-24]|uniref:hypothetical protein n=1 Tax=Halomicrococcus sp. NG-SE-24 TaxID=3436928 RepID=UPI003D976D1B